MATGSLPVASTTREERAPAPAVPETTGVAAGEASRAGRWLPLDLPTRQAVELAATAVTLVAMFAAFGLEHLAGRGWSVTALYALAYVAGGTFGLQGGLAALRHGRLDVDLLMVVAAIGAWLVNEPFQGAMLLFLFSLSNVLQDYAMDRSRNAIRTLMKLRPKQALVRRPEGDVLMPIEQVRIGDRVLVKPGELLPLDGVVVAGESTVNQASITGESVPVHKGPGDTAFAGTINGNGSLELEVSRLAQDTTLAKLIALVEEAQAQKAQTQRLIDRWEPYYAWFVVGLTVAAAAVPVLVFGEAFEPAFYRAITLMVAASPCALVISTPASILSGIGNGARRGILFKGGVYLEQAAGIKVVAFDKTGTLTVGKPRLTDVHVVRGTEDELLALAGAVEAKSEHALARATVEAATQRNLHLAEAFAFQAATGKGVRGVVGTDDIRIGNLRYFEAFDTPDLPTVVPVVERFQREGKTSVVVARVEDTAEPDGAGPKRPVARVLGVLAFADVLRPEAAEVVAELRAAGVRVAMLTGDHAEVARVIARAVGVDEVYADLLPEDKVRIIKELGARYGPVAMVGDGVNDAPALATAAVGIAMGAAGSDVALETADIVLMSDNLRNVPYVIALSQQTRRTLLINLGVALGAIGIMIASILAFGMPLPLAVVGHEGGTVLVSLNGLRLLLFKHRRRAAAPAPAPA